MAYGMGPKNQVTSREEANAMINSHLYELKLRRETGCNHEFVGEEVYEGAIF
jgi:hypothetical protein